MSRNLVVCCDGTWQTPDQTEDGVPCPTNVVKLYNVCVDDERQRRYYHPGVGSEGGLVDRLLGGSLGAGLGRNIASAYEWLCRHYARGDRIFLFGFSRGAYTARSLGGMITRCGLLDLSAISRREAWQRVGDVYARGYRRPRPPAHWPSDYHFLGGPLAGGAIDIHLIGVWDTVGALGVPDDLVILDELVDDPQNYRFHDTELSPAVRHARHALAMDETRASFSPTLWTNGSERPANGSFAQLWFPGTHSDVGGGYAQSGLSDAALEWMLDAAVDVGLLVDPALRAQIRPDARGVLHDSAADLWQLLRTLPRATPRVDRALVGRELSALVCERNALPPLAQAPYWPTRVLGVGEETSFAVFAREHWNASGLYLEAGCRYAFAARGEWIDGGIACGPAGAKAAKFDPGKLAQLFGSLFGDAEKIYQKLTGKAGADWWGTKRVEAADWFELTGMIANQPNSDGSGTPDCGELIVIGDKASHVPRRSGYLYCFANDAWKFYGNNRGSVELSVRRVA